MTTHGPYGKQDLNAHRAAADYRDALGLPHGRMEGYCPECGQQLSMLTPGGRGFCPYHEQWVIANWHAPERKER